MIHSTSPMSQYPLSNISREHRFARITVETFTPRASRKCTFHPSDRLNIALRECIIRFRFFTFKALHRGLPRRCDQDEFVEHLTLPLESALNWFSERFPSQDKVKTPHRMSRCGIHSDYYRILLQFLNVFRFQTLLAFDYVKADAVVFGERLEATSTNCLVMHENVRAVILGYKPEALLVAKPFHGSFCQLFHLPYQELSSALERK